MDGSHHVPNPPPRTHSRPNQPPPPPPLPSVPPVPPTRDSSIAISRAAINKHSPIPPIGAQSNHSARPLPASNAKPVAALATTRTTTSSSSPSSQIVNGTGFLTLFIPLFKPIDELPPPEPFMNRPKSYPSQRAQQQTQSIEPKTQV